MLKVKKMEKTEFENMMEQIARKNSYIGITYKDGSRDEGIIENNEFLSMNLVPAENANGEFIGEKLDHTEIESITILE